MYIYIYVYIICIYIYMCVCIFFFPDYPACSSDSTWDAYSAKVSHCKLKSWGHASVQGRNMGNVSPRQTDDGLLFANKGPLWEWVCCSADICGFSTDAPLLLCLLLALYRFASFSSGWFILSPHKTGCWHTKVMPDACQCSGLSIRHCRNECHVTHSAVRDSQMRPYRLSRPPTALLNSQVAFSCPGCIVQVRAVWLRSIVCPGVFGMSTRPFSKSRSTRARGRRSDSPWSEHIDPATGPGF